MISYDQLGIKGLQKVFLAVTQSCRTLEIDFYVVGAVSKNIWLAENQKEISGTKDVDFAVYISSIEKYQALKEKLINDYQYKPSSDNAFRLISYTGHEIDLLPFGEIEKDGMVEIEGTGLVDIKLAGFKEVYELGQRNVIIEDNEYMACSIPSIVILKFIAYDDRPEMRNKDIRDIVSIFKNYPEIESELIWGNHNDLYDEEVHHDQIGLIVLGREMKKIVESNSDLHNRLIGILKKAMLKNSKIPDLMIADVLKETIQMQTDKLNFVLTGLR